MSLVPDCPFEKSLAPDNRCLNPIKKPRLLCSLINLWSQIELEEPIVCVVKVKLHQKRRIWAQANFNTATKRRCLGKRHQIPQGKRGSDWLVNCQSNSLFRLIGLPWFQQNITRPNVALNTKSDALLGCIDRDGLTKLLQILRNSDDGNFATTLYCCSGPM